MRSLNYGPIVDQFPKSGINQVETTTDKDGDPLGRFGTSGLKNILNVDRFPPLSIGNFTEQQASYDPTFWHFERPRRDVRTIPHFRLLSGFSTNMIHLASHNSACLIWIV